MPGGWGRQGFVRGVREEPACSDIQAAIGQVGWERRLEIINTSGAVKCTGMGLQPQESH